MRKTQFIFGFIIINFLLLTVSNVAGTVEWIYYDTEDDVTYYDHSVPQYQGDYHDEIDIVQAELDGSNIIFRFQAAPIDSLSHIYYLYLYWTQSAGFNSTTAIFGMGNNVISTYLHNSVGHEVASLSVQDNITIVSNYLLMSIPLFAQIPGTDNPYYIQLQSIVLVGTSLQYEDFCNGTNFSEPPSQTTPVALPIIGFIVVICVSFVLDKKNRK